MQADARKLVAIVRETRWLMRALEVTRALGLHRWCIGAGAVRGAVWDSLHGFDVPSALPDVDVVYFDAADLRAEQEAAYDATLRAAHPSLNWEVTNQAAVHLWFERCFRRTVAPLASLEEGVASWPEYATCVGVTLRADDGIDVIAPHGLDDLFSMTIRHNPIRASVRDYQQRIAAKRYAERWPKVRII